MDQNPRPIKKVTFAKKKYENSNMSEEVKNSDNVKRKSSNDGPGFSVKQTKKEDENTVRKRQIEYVNKEVESEDDAANFEEDFDDEWEDEEVINPKPVKNSNVEEEEEWEDDEEDDADAQELADQFKDLKFSDDPVIYVPPEKNSKKKNKKGKNDEPRPFLGTDKDLQEGEVLEYDNEAYDLFHRMTTDWPCLSFDVLLPGNKPQSGAKSQVLEYPLTIYTVAGSQAPQGEKNSLYIMKWSELHKTRYDDDSEIVDEEDVDNDEEAQTHTLTIKLDAAVNRIRSMNGCGVVALWGEDGAVSIYDCTKHLETLAAYNEYEEELFEGEEVPKKKLEIPKDPRKKNFLLQRFQHKSEGFAIQWSPHTVGLLASGTCNKEIFFYKPVDENGSEWIMDNVPYKVHSNSVEDLQFSPNHESILASCSADGTIKFIDFRQNGKNEWAGTINASQTDVNVIHWNSYKPNLLASGCEDGTIQIWDIRYINKGRSVAEIQWHKDPITSIEFQPFEDSIVTAACADNRITIWDFSVEADVKSKNDDIPEQLMFIHQGIVDVKEIRHHPSMAEIIMSTAENGFNVFKPNYDEGDDDQ